MTSTKRKSKEEYEKVIELHKKGLKIVDIIKETGLKRSCINNWIRGVNGKSFSDTYIKNVEDKHIANPIDFLKYLNNENTLLNYEYSYVLGLYLGDGNISSNSRTKQFNITLDKKYEKLNDEVVKTFNKLFGKLPYVYDKSIDRGQKYVSNCIVIRYTNKNIGVIFPHEGIGRKHNRKIELSEWQKQIIDPVGIVKGLFFSDGCYYYDTHNKKYMYNFNNRSNDIIGILVTYLAVLKINYNVMKYEEKTILTVKTQSDVKLLHDLIGDKENIVYY